MARYQEQQAFRPGSGDTGQANLQNSLANRLGQFGQQMTNMFAEQRQVQGAEDAERADPKAPVLQNKTTVYGQSYNDTILNAHQAHIKSDYSLKLEQFAVEHESDPDGFAKKANAVRSAVVEQALPEIRQMTEIGFDNLAGSYLNRIKSNHKDKTVKAALTSQIQAAKTSQADIIRMVRNGQDKSAVEEFAALRVLLDESDLPEKDKAAIIGETQRGMVEQTYYDDLESMPPNEGMKYLEQLSQDIPEGYTPEQWDKFIAQAQTFVGKRKSRLAEDKIELTLSQSRAISDLEVEINSEFGDPEQQVKAINDLFDAEWISPEKRTSLLTKISKRMKDTEIESETLSNIYARINGDDSIVVDRAAADKVYEKRLSKVLETDAQKATIVDALKYVPKMLKNEIVNGLRSGNPDLIRESIKVMDRVSSIEGIDENTFSSQDQAFASEVLPLLEYMEPDKAIDMARRNTNPADKARIEARKSIINEENSMKRREAYTDEVMNRFDEVFLGTSVDEYSRDRLASHFGQLTEAFFLDGASMDNAKDLAERKMKTIWKMSESTGKKRMQRYAPEMYYGYGDNKWMQEQLREDITKHLYSQSYLGDGAGIEIGDDQEIILTAHDQTSREASKGAPTYIVSLVTENGVVPLRGFVWRPDPRPVIEADKEKNRANVEENYQELLKPWMEQ